MHVQRPAQLNLRFFLGGGGGSRHGEANQVTHTK